MSFSLIQVSNILQQLVLHLSLEQQLIQGSRDNNIKQTHTLMLVPEGRIHSSKKKLSKAVARSPYIMDQLEDSILATKTID
jgi:hypothetical protein